MLDRLNNPSPQLARLRYDVSDFQVVAPGSHVNCAITDKAIPLDELKYWSYDRQEAYVDAAASLMAEIKAGNLT